MFRRCVVLTALAVSLSAGVSHVATGAATDGTLGTTSTGTVPVTLTMPAVVKISNLSEVTFNYTEGDTSGDLINTQHFCVYTNQASGAYSLTISDAGKSSSEFQLNESGSGETKVPYELYFTDAVVDASSGTLTKVTPGSSISGTNANTTSLDCEGTMVTTLKLVIPENSLAAVVNGTYTDTLTLVVSPTSN